MNGTILDNNETFSFVGVFFEQDLNWHEHISVAAKKKFFNFVPENIFQLQMSVQGETES